MSTGHTTLNRDDQNNLTSIQMQVLASKVLPKSEMKQFFVITLGTLKYIFFYLISGLKEETERLRWYPESVNWKKRIYKIITVKR